MEWIPLREEDYLSYWKSGGKEWLTAEIGVEAYELVEKEFRLAISDNEILMRLGIKEYQSKNESWFLLPSWHLYHVAKKGDPIPYDTANINAALLVVPVRAYASMRMAIDGITSSEHFLSEINHLCSDLLKTQNRELVYIAKLDASQNDPGLYDDCFNPSLESRKCWVEFGRETGLPTFTQTLTVLENNHADSYNVHNPAPVAVIGYITDSEQEGFSILSKLSHQPSTGEILKFFHLWQEDTLNNSVDKQRLAYDPNHNQTIKEGLGFDSIDPLKSSWPRLFIFSDLAVETINCFISVSPDPSYNYLQPLRYFDWQMRVTTPDPQIFYIATTVVRMGRKVNVPRSLFAMFSEKRKMDKSILHFGNPEDLILLQLILSLGGFEIAEAKRRESEALAFERDSKIFSEVRQDITEGIELFKEGLKRLQKAESIIDKSFHWFLGLYLSIGLNLLWEESRTVWYTTNYDNKKSLTISKTETAINTVSLVTIHSISNPSPYVNHIAAWKAYAPVVYSLGRTWKIPYFSDPITENNDNSKCKAYLSALKIMTQRTQSAPDKLNELSLILHLAMSLAGFPKERSPAFYYNDTIIINTSESPTFCLTCDRLFNLNPGYFD